ncbi:glucosamine-6-phosphate deaminase [Dyadobacter sediminis]|uniref:Glucosamine-6-phosphate deaminase n=1 Tax=Dyadobacter sediminis TaxID=1493691 RepID=A0A5R9K945_9BACT|nr:glucosamine-6-phosphate deaminase [Dyadobacter sediminis]TLU90545.1 glucosamine-6-phosphate deaminase [Dyadobacter sediminis]GGC08673.1 glucosamine-6-phosphate deaminase [Dyadobacter sediminis]
MKVDQLEIRIFDTRQEMGENAAKMVADKILELQQSQEFVNIIFASAPSQNEFLAALKEEKGIAWEKINAFHMDEYVGLPSDAPQNFGYFLKVKLFDHVPLHSVSYLDGNAADLEKECERYAQLLRENPIDIVCLGIGENGHLAFNDPHVAFFDDPLTVKMVELDHACRQQQVNDACFTAFGEVPETALTLTIPTLLKAKHAYAIVPGEKKAQAIYHTVAEDIKEEFPSTILRKHPNAILFIDKASSGKLKEISSYSQA